MASDIEALRTEIAAMRAESAALLERIPKSLVRIYGTDEAEKLPFLTAMLGDLEEMVKNFPTDHQEFVGTLYRIGHDEDGNNIFIPMVKSHNRKRALKSYWPWIVTGASLGYALWQAGVLGAVVSSFVGVSQ